MSNYKFLMGLAAGAFLIFAGCSSNQRPVDDDPSDDEIARFFMDQEEAPAPDRQWAKSPSSEPDGKKKEEGFKGVIPEGRWLDSTYNAVWAFSADKIELYDSVTGRKYQEFTESNTRNWKVNKSGNSPSVSFRCDATRRSYTFTRSLADNSLTMEVWNDTWGRGSYKTTIRYQKK